MKRRFTKRAEWLGALAVLGLLLWLPAAHAQDSPGKAAYLKYCSACHGSAGKGDGVVSQYMRPKPTDLTQIAKQNKGEFPMLPTMQAIDGTTSVRAHGDPDMPVWGEIFKREVRDGMDPRPAVQSRVMAITEYLRSIQEK